jgi:hypothetical protein
MRESIITGFETHLAICRVDDVTALLAAAGFSRISPEHHLYGLLYSGRTKIILKEMRISKKE